MQFYTPVNGIPNGGQTFPCNPFPAAQSSSLCPQVIGEGDVASVTLPDGTIQLYFVPTSRSPPSPYYPSYINIANNLWNSNPTAWFIRSLPYPFPSCQPNVLNHQYQRVISNSPFLQNSIENQPGYQLKFHSDGWTSTTDIHYFYPSLRYHNWFPKLSAATQVEQSPPCHHSELGYLRACLCINSCGETKTKPTHNETICTCKENNNSNKEQDACCGGQSSSSSIMSVEVAKVQNATCHNDKQQRKKIKYFKKVKKREMYQNIECACDPQTAPEKLTKACATFSEQASGCCEDKGQETQTTCEPCSPIRRDSSFFQVNDVETELWYPITPQSLKVMTRESGGSEMSESGSCSGAFASDSDTPSHK